MAHTHRAPYKSKCQAAARCTQDMELASFFQSGQGAKKVSEASAECQAEEGPHDVLYAQSEEAHNMPNCQAFVHVLL